MDDARNQDLEHALPLGTKLGGCTVEAVLAADQDGFVYRMADSLLLGRVAIKEYFPRAHVQRAGAEVHLRSQADEVAFAAGLQAFVHEARLLAGMQHPGLLHVLDTFDANQTTYRVMPLVDGATLEQARHQHAAPPDVQWLRELMMSLLEPLEALHGAGLLHGDIHPRKVMLRADGRPLLMGFGSVSRALHLPPDPAYAPLEQTAPGGHLPRGAWTDFYALGALVWFAATGRAPVASTERRAGAVFSPAATLSSALQGGSASQRDRAQLVAAVDRAMAVLPPDRPQTCAELRALFTAPSTAVEPEAAMAAERPPIYAHEPARARPLFAPRIGRRHRLAVAAGVAALAVGGVAGVLVWRWNEASQAGSLAAIARSTAPVPAAASAPDALPGAAVADDLPPRLGTLDRVPPPAAGVATAPAPPAATAAAPAPAPAPAEEPSPAPGPAEPAKRPAAPPRAVAEAPAPPPATPRAACGSRTKFSLHYCMQAQCRRPQFRSHEQCVRFRETGFVE